MSVQTSAVREPAKFWINIGYIMNGKKITLPFGCPLDSMKLLETRSRNEDWSKLQIARNDLLEQVRRIAAGCNPGEDKEVALKVFVRRAAEQEDLVPVGENSYKKTIEVIS